MALPRAMRPEGAPEWEEVKLALGEEHTVSFGGSPGVGDNWSLFVHRGAEFAEVDRSKGSQVGFSSAATDGSVGGKGRWQWTFVGKQKGVTMVDFDYSFRGGDQQTEKYCFLVDGAEAPKPRKKRRAPAQDGSESADSIDTDELLAGLSLSDDDL
jgi:predicted secreted protein